jgi:hypothetical protein
LKALGPPRNSPLDCRTFLAKAVAQHHLILADALRGIYDHEFFSTKGKRSTRLRDEFNALGLAFEIAISKYSEVNTDELTGAAPDVLSFFDGVWRGPCRTRSKGSKVHEGSKILAVWVRYAWTYIAKACEIARHFLEQSFHFVLTGERAIWDRLMCDYVNPYFDRMACDIDDQFQLLEAGLSTSIGRKMLSQADLTRPLHTFVDNTNMFIMMRFFDESLFEVFSAGTVTNMTNAAVVALAKESSSRTLEREVIRGEENSLHSILENCRKERRRGYPSKNIHRKLGYLRKLTALS